MAIFRSVISLLILLAFNCCPLPSELWGASVLDKGRQPIPPPITTPHSNPDALKSSPAILKEPGFQIGYLIPSRTGFENCSTPAGYILSVSHSGPALNYVRDWSIRYCAKGNVTVTQTNPLLNMTGKKLRLWVVHNEIGSFGASSWDKGTVDEYELPFQQKDSATFQVVFASGWKANPSTADPVAENLDYLSKAFANPSELGFFVQYLDPAKRDEGLAGVYPALLCWFTSLPSGTVPPRDSVDCPGGPTSAIPWQNY